MRPLFALTAAVVAASMAAASPIAGNGALGDFTGDFAYSYNAGTQKGTVTVQLTNAPTTSPGGKLVAFAFNLPNNPGGLSVNYTAVGPNGTALALLGGSTFNNSVPVNPFGDADLGAGLGGDWLGGGSPNAGLQIGQSGTWTFELSGNAAYLSGLTTAGIYNTPSSGGGGGAFGFLVRFRGFDNGGSDKVPGGTLGNPNPPPNPQGDPTVPEPVSVVTFAVVGGLGAVGMRLRRKKAA